MAQRYANGFKCHKCPGRNDEQGCPAWVEFTVQDLASGRDDIKKMCLFQALPLFLVEVIKASNRPAAECGAIRAAVEEGLKENRQDIEQGFLAMAGGLQMIGAEIQARTVLENHAPRLVGERSLDSIPAASGEPGG